VELLTGAFLASLTALAIGLVLLGAEDRIRRFTRPRMDHRARQASHCGDPLRLGGVAVLGGMAVGLIWESLSSSGSFLPAWALSALPSAVPVVAAGLAEDLGYRVSPARRFAAAILAAGLAVALLGIWVPRGDLPGIDALMAWPVVAILITVVFSGVFCHAVNLIDGLNGLALTVSLAAAVGIAAIALKSGQPAIADAALALAAAGAGLFVLNWPVARLFLGDAGAYGIGHLLVWMAVATVWGSQEVAVPALLLALFWPIADVLHTVIRRALAGQRIFSPDRLHLHQLIRRTLEVGFFGYRRVERSNPLTTLILAPMILAPVLTGIWLWDRPGAAWLALVGYLGLFAATYAAVSRLMRRISRKKPFGISPRLSARARSARSRPGAEGRSVGQGAPRFGK
jgi:UDP-N-acetylmuramyl pentapeptide phosphotransferase/UDP-N-acetylglucosamine-1-phosphate transferase